jgi:uncharacterized LabA/DUF88 family protein
MKVDMNRVCVYVDGFNLYFGLKSKGWRKHYWLNLQALSASLLKPGQSLEAVHYFTSRIRINGNNQKSMQRQTCYLEALGTLKILQTHLGHFLEKQRMCRSCGGIWTGYEEKMTDVNIAVQMMKDAFADNFDTAILISGDSDLTSPLRTLRQQFPSKRLIVAFPPGRNSAELSKAAHGFFTIGEANLRQSQLAQQVVRQDGFVLNRPATWQ